MVDKRIKQAVETVAYERQKALDDGDDERAENLKVVQNQLFAHAHD